MIKGIDVSSVQGISINWHEVAATGVQFVVVKCGNGNDGIDPDFARNIAGAKAAGLEVVCYHFVYPLPPKAGDPSRSPQAQAQKHFDASQGVLAACDLEWPEPKDWAHWGCTAAQINQWGLEYLAAYSALSGRPMIIYTYPNFAQNIKYTVGYAQYPLWIASYAATPTIPAPWADWVLWQISGGTGPDAAHLPNGTPVDADVAKDLSLWQSFATNVSSNSPVNDPNPASVTNDPNPVPDPTIPAPVPASPAPINANFFTAIGGIISKLFSSK